MNQTAIWSHIQNEIPELFLGVETRVDKLLKIAGSRGDGRTLLNIGAGNGYLESRASQSGWRVISVDPDKRTCARLVSSGIDGRVGRIEDLPIESESIDVVIATEVLEHLSTGSLRAGLAEIKRVLVTGGLLVGTVPRQENLATNVAVCPECNKVFHRYGHQQSFAVGSISAELATYLSVRTCHAVLLPPWSILNWKGKVVASMQLFLSRLGIHGSQEKILFVCQKSHGEIAR